MNHSLLTFIYAFALPPSLACSLTIRQNDGHQGQAIWQIGSALYYKDQKKTFGQYW